MLNLTKPRYVLPSHGDHKRIRLHSELAEAVGIDPDAIFRGENGLPLEIDERGAGFGTPEQAGMIFVDGVDVGDIEDVALRDRRMLSADGIFIVVATVSEQDGRSVADPEIIFRGVPFAEEQDVVEELRGAVEESLARVGRGRGQGDLPAPDPPPRRPRGVRLPAPQAPADGAARGGRGLIGSLRPAYGGPAGSPGPISLVQTYGGTLSRGGGREAAPRAFRQLLPPSRVIHPIWVMNLTTLCARAAGAGTPRPRSSNREPARAAAGNSSL